MLNDQYMEELLSDPFTCECNCGCDADSVSVFYNELENMTILVCMDCLMGLESERHDEEHPLLDDHYL